VLPEDAGAAAWWDEFWTSDRNAPVLAADELQKLSEIVLKDGETFLTYFFAFDGEFSFVVVKNDGDFCFFCWVFFLSSVVDEVC